MRANNPMLTIGLLVAVAMVILDGEGFPTGFCILGWVIAVALIVLGVVRVVKRARSGQVFEDENEEEPYDPNDPNNKFRRY